MARAKRGVSESPDGAQSPALGGLAGAALATLRGDGKGVGLSTGEAEGRKPGRLLVASYNIHKAVGVDGRFDPDRIAAVIAEIDPDVIALQEADQRFGARAGLLDLALLERECGLIPVPVENRQSRGQSHGWCGNVVLFRGGAVAGARRLTLPGVEPRGALIVDLDLSGGPLRVIAAHLGLLRHSRAQQVVALTEAAANGDGRPAVLMGDLNEWRLGARSSLQGLAPRFGPLTTAIPSFPSRFPVLALDRIVGAPHTLVARVERHETPLSRVASDHLPLKAVLDRVSTTVDA